MRLLRAAVAAGVLAAQPALAASILYATAASHRRVDSYCLLRDGTLVPTPKERIPLGNQQPRRLRVVTFPGGSKVLYVAQLNRIEAFSIGRRGGLSRLGSTPAASGMDPRDMAIDPVRLKLYVPQRGFNRIVAYPLDPNGRPLPPTDEFPNGFTSCAQGFVPAGYQEVWLETARGLLYVSADGLRGRVEVHRLGADGGFIAKDENGIEGPVLPPQCRRTFRTDRPARTTPFSEHTGLSQPKAILLDGDMLYVEDRAARRLLAFQLAPDGSFCPPSPIPKGEVKNFGEDAKCSGFHPLKEPRCARQEQRKGRRQQCAASRTKSIFGYERLTRHGDTIIGTGFLRGRIDVYRLQTEGEPPRLLLPRRPTGPSAVDVRMTPVGLVTNAMARECATDTDCDDGNGCTTEACSAGLCVATPIDACQPGDADDGILYVAAGELDRVIAFRVGPNGRLRSTIPFSRTDELKGSFPNDVAIAVLPDGCQ
jgi:hypothetical protein